VLKRQLWASGLNADHLGIVVERSGDIVITQLTRCLSAEQAKLLAFERMSKIVSKATLHNR
jgi:hypothetical protein